MNRVSCQLHFSKNEGKREPHTHTPATYTRSNAKPDDPSGEGDGPMPYGGRGHLLHGHKKWTCLLISCSRCPLPRMTSPLLPCTLLPGRVSFPDLCRHQILTSSSQSRHPTSFLLAPTPVSTYFPLPPPRITLTEVTKAPLVTKSTTVGAF